MYLKEVGIKWDDPSMGDLVLEPLAANWDIYKAVFLFLAGTSAEF